MKRKISTLLIISISLTAGDLTPPPMPPMPPGMFAPMDKKVSTKDTNKTKKQNEAEKKLEENPCSIIPPMLYRLHAPLLNLVDKCQTKLLKPSIESVKNKLIKNGYPKDLNITSIEALKDSNRLYKVKIKNQQDLICDEKIKICFKSEPIIFK